MKPVSFHARHQNVRQELNDLDVEIRDHCRDLEFSSSQSLESSHLASMSLSPHRPPPKAPPPATVCLPFAQDRRRPI
jgi:hypothetical protein